MKETKVFELGIDDLGIDKTNVRTGGWDNDEQLISSIKSEGVLAPLLIRPAGPKTGFKYGIISGSRRYHASIEAGLKTVPCIIKDVDDVTAIGISIMENRHRTDISGWVYAEKIKKMSELINHGATNVQKVKIIMAKTALKKSAVYDYLDLMDLPEETFELMRKPEERSKKVQELTKTFPPSGKEERPLSKDKAVKIATRLKDFSDEKKFEVGRFVSGLKEETAIDVIEKVRVHPEKPLTEIKKIVEGIPKSEQWAVQFNWEPNLTEALDEACVKKNMDRKNLVTNYIRQGLKKDGFL